MSYTFSRRNFMKYTALAAVAVAGSSLFTGCSNSNQPTGKAGATLSIIGKHTLYNDATNGLIEYSNNKLVCHFHHEPIKGSAFSTSYPIEVNIDHYAVLVVKDGTTTEYYKGNMPGVTFTGAKGSMSTSDPVDFTLTVDGIEGLADADAVLVRYFPRRTAMDNPNDTYLDCYATWDITEAIAALSAE